MFASISCVFILTRVDSYFTPSQNSWIYINFEA